MSDTQRYFDAVRAMQSGVAAVMEFDPSETTPKHLRVGVNSAMCEHAALVKMLIAKGIISEEEYVKAQADQMELEKESYEKRLSKHYNNAAIKLA